jgi:HEAT repeat protein
LLSDPDPMVRSSACFATSAVADPELLPRLVRALDDSAYVVRVSALDGIVAQDSAAIDALTARAAAPGVGATWALAGLEQIDHDGSALSLLRLEASLASWSAGARVAYAKALYAHRRRESVLDALGRLEGDSDWRVVAIARRSRE